MPASTNPAEHPDMAIIATTILVKKRIGGAVTANIVIGAVVDQFGWDAGLAIIIAACIMAVVVIAATWVAESR